MTNQKFLYEFERESTNRITFEYSPEADEKFDSKADGDMTTLYLNKPGMITIAQILIKMAEGEYDRGFHVHLKKDFNADLPDRLTIVLSPNDAPPYR